VNSEDRRLVIGLLAQAGLVLPANEAEDLMTFLPLMRRSIELLHAVNTERYEIPALTFDPRPAAP
jgi:hypothetical protein